jgi:hypothetical protein
MSEWVDLQLSHQLASAKAPDELWARVQTGRPVHTRRMAPRLALATAAAVLAVIAVAYSATKPRELHQTTSFTTATCTSCHTM